MIENAAVFVGGQRKFKNVNVDVEPEFVILKNRMNGSEIARYSVVEVAKENMAWDINDPSQGLIRLVVQQGCGCSGMFPYENDPTYSGAIQVTHRR